METFIHRALKWLKYSGASVSVTLNPMHWRWTFLIGLAKQTEWPSPNERMLTIGWLFLTIRIWIDDGSW